MPARLLMIMFAQTGPDALPLTLQERWWLFAGKLHPMIVHFPIALLIVAALIEIVRRRRRAEFELRPSPTATTCLTLGACSAIVAAVLGWSDAVTSGHGADVMLTHRWMGVGAAVLAVIAVIAAGAARVRESRHSLSAYRSVLLLTALLVTAAGHYGAALVHGDLYIMDALALLRDSPRQTRTLVGSTHASPQAAIGNVDFARDIRPIFGRRCFACHSGNDPASGLNLDDRANILVGGDSGQPTLAPGDAAHSRLITLITTGDGDLHMPPKGAPLDAEQIALLTRWINQGAKWATPAEAGEHRHWAYNPPRRPNLAQVQDTNWPANPIDNFILARLEAEGLKPSPQADRATLLRRVSLDLTGLPPTPDELRAFLSDRSANAYERVVDRLLASPHYGEHWARIWLDLARYADTNGYEKDDRRVMWPWRDWIINAFNADMPFDKFTIEQLAGDLLPNATLDQLIATGFNRNSMINEEGGVDAEEFRVEAVIDRVNTFGSVWLGSTIGCTQCHDHKFDPFTQHDYYSLFAFFNQDAMDTRIHATGAFAAGPMVDVPKMEDRAEYAKTTADIAQVEAQLQHARDSASRAAAIAEWENGPAKPQPAWTTLKPEKVTAANGTTFTIGDDGTITAGGPTPEKDTYIVEATCDLQSIAALCLEVMPDESTPAKAVGRSSHGNIVLSDVRIEIVRGAAGEPHRVDPASIIPIVAALADFEQPRTFGGGGFWPIADSIDDDDKTGGWALGPQMTQAHVAVLQLGSVVKREDASPIRLRITLAQNYGNQHTLARIRQSATDDANALAMQPLSPEIRAILATAADQRSIEQRTQLATYFDSIAPDLAPQRAQLLTLRKQRQQLIAARAMVMHANDKPRDTFIHVRGNFLDHGEPVQPDVPAIFPPLPPASDTSARDRLALAKWTVDPNNPLTARVAVNRFWEQLFGRGLVASSDDFGTQGDAPANQQLLDWLATEFVREGWSMKRLLKLIVMSETYQQASNITPALHERDPQNTLLARGPRFRVEAETVRDIALAASGLLNTKVGGPSVFPPQPEGIWTMIYSSDKWTNSTGDDAHRRGLYTFWRRTAPYPSFTTFDAPSRELACTRRARTNTPLQALTTLNDPAFVEASNALARRIMTDGGEDTRSRIEYGFILCVSRAPEPHEIETVMKLHDEERASFANDVAAAEKLTGAKGQQAVDLAAWQVVANVLLNLDETITKE